MDVFVTNEQSDLSLSLPTVQLAVEEVLLVEKRRTDEVSVHFVDKKRITELHATYFQDPTPTDCISFPIDTDEGEAGGYSVLGEVFVCPAVALEYVAREGGDPYEEVTLYVVHGLLHLMGYNDIEETDREEMRAAEKRLLARLHRRDKCIKEGP